MAKKSVLIIDDDGWLADEYVRQLALAGFDAIHAPNALEGMEAIDAATPDVIILDVFMPGPNGIVLLHEIRSHNDLADIPVIIASNSTTDMPPAGLAHYGVSSMLDKATMHPSDIVAAVKKVTA